MPKGKAFIFVCVGFICGTGFFSFTAQSSVLLYCTGSLLGILFFLIFKKKQQIFLQIAILVFFGFCISGVRYMLSYPVINNRHISFFNGQEKVFSGLVIVESKVTVSGRQLIIRVDDPYRGKILVNSAAFPEYVYGDRVEVRCMLQKPENREFAYDRYLARLAIYSICKRPFIKRLASEQGNGVYSFLLEVKRKSYETAQLYLPEPTASLALPVVFGSGEIDDDISDSFRRTGLTHIMAVSGFNVSLLAALLSIVLAYAGVSRRLIFYMSALVIIAYVAIVGAPASAVRAGVMSIFLLLALTAGRLVSIPRLIVIVAVMTLMMNPRSLRDDIGWQLSFLALLGLVYILPYLQKWTMHIVHGRGKIIIEAILATVAAQLATAPIIVYNFGQFSIIAPLANVLVVWMIPMLTVSVMLALPLAALFPALGEVLFFLPWLMVKYIFTIVGVLSGLPWASVQLEI